MKEKGTEFAEKTRKDTRTDLISQNERKQRGKEEERRGEERRGEGYPSVVPL